jgi:hypothetical protein
VAAAAAVAPAPVPERRLVRYLDRRWQCDRRGRTIQTGIGGNGGAAARRHPGGGGGGGANGGGGDDFGPRRGGRNGGNGGRGGHGGGGGGGPSTDACVSGGALNVFTVASSARPRIRATGRNANTSAADDGPWMDRMARRITGSLVLLLVAGGLAMADAPVTARKSAA